ncbi:MAG: hypothetical protein ACRCTE_06550 [Cellulosilyticaceae bacterium]
MEMNWVYLLIGVLYVVLGINKLLYGRLEKQVQQNAKDDFSKHIILKEDFFTTVAIVCVVGTLIINILCLIGGNRLNVSSIIVTILVIGLALLSALVPMWGNQEGFELGDYTLTDEAIKEVKAKTIGQYVHYKVSFTEEQNGYDKIGFYCAQKHVPILQNKIKKINTKD